MLAVNFMRLYVDANIIIESVCAGVNGNDLVEQAFTYQERGESLISSVLTAVEIDRFLWRRRSRKHGDANNASRNRSTCTHSAGD